MAGNVKQNREAAMVRRYLELLADSAGTAKRGQVSIDSVSAKYDIPAFKLRDFRDGRQESLDRSVISMFATVLGRPGGMEGYELDDSLGFADPSNGGWYGAMMAEETIRQARLRTYQLIDRTRPEAHSALHCWSDMGVTGNIGEDTRYGGGFEPVCYGTSQLVTDLMRRTENLVNGQLLPDDQKLLVFRGMAKYGDQYGEIGLTKSKGRYEVGAVVPLHARTMQIVRDPKTGAYDPNYAFKQVIPGQTDAVAKFPEWKIAHFSNTEGWGDVYGASIFECCLRSYIQIESMEAGMMIRRLERAAMRYKHFVDTGLVDGGEDEVRKVVKEYAKQHTKVRTVDGSKNYRNQKINMPADADFIVPKRDKDSPADIIPVEGDGNIGLIADFEVFQNKWFSGLGPPKAHLGYEDGKSKSGVNDLHIVFARKVRRMQLKFIAGLNHLYWVSLMLKGIDPRTIRYTIFPPAMGTRDELIRAQIMLARATTVSYLGQAFATTGEAPTPEWFLKYVMGMDEGVVDSLELKAVMPGSSGGTPGFKNPPPKNVKDSEDMAAFALTSPDVRRHVEELRLVFDSRAIQMKVPEVGQQLARACRPVWISRGFDDVVRSMGVKELRAA